MDEPRERLEILYQHKALVVINKPSGLLIHRSMIDRTETRFAMQTVRDQVGQHVFLLHRLDKPTSGVLIFALLSELAKHFTAGRLLLHCTRMKMKHPVSGESLIFNAPLDLAMSQLFDRFGWQDFAGDWCR